jgi:hypothetical protein
MHPARSIYAGFTDDPTLRLANVSSDIDSSTQNLSWGWGFRRSMSRLKLYTFDGSHLVMFDGAAVHTQAVILTKLQNGDQDC